MTNESERAALAAWEKHRGIYSTNISHYEFMQIWNQARAALDAKNTHYTHKNFKNLVDLLSWADEMLGENYVYSAYPDMRQEIKLVLKNMEGVHSAGQVVSPEAASNGLSASNKDDNLAPSALIEKVAEALKQAEQQDEPTYELMAEYAIAAIPSLSFDEAVERSMKIYHSTGVVETIIRALTANGPVIIKGE